MSRMIDHARYGREYVADYDRLVDEITAADIQQMAKTILRSGNRIEVGMTSPVE